jgi:predicted GNAT family acetyltransferase
MGIVSSYKAVEGLLALDNPGWHSLNTHHAHLAIGTGLARRFPPQVAAFCAVADHSDAAFSDLAEIVAKGQTVALFETRLPPELPGWTEARAFMVVQMVCDQPVAEPNASTPILDLNEADVPDMLSLVELTHPGPFFQRTIEMGHYVGIRQQGQLVAMAGERFHLQGYRELSAICTHPEHQGKGYARLLTSRLVHENWQRSDVPFLHVVAENAPAVHLYESLHFHRRAEMHVTVLTR